MDQLHYPTVPKLSSQPFSLWLVLVPIHMKIWFHNIVYKEISRSNLSAFNGRYLSTTYMYLDVTGLLLKENNTGFLES